MDFSDIFKETPRCMYFDVRIVFVTFSFSLLAHSPTHSLTHPQTNTAVHPPTHSLPTHPLTHSQTTHPPTHHQLIHSSTHPVIHSFTHLSGIMFSVYNVFWSHSVVWSIMKVKLNSGVNTVQTSSADIIHSLRECHSKGVACVWASEGFVELPVVVFQCERTQIFVMSYLGAFNVNWWLFLSCTTYTSPVSRT